MAIVGVIPAAGSAERLQPLAGSKEVFPIGGRPVMAYLVERMLAVPGVGLRVVTRPEKEDVAACARRLGADVIEGRPPTPAASLLAGIEGLDAADTVLVGFPDTIWEPPDGYLRLVPRLAEADVVLGLFRSVELTRSDVVSADETARVRRVDVKPSRPASDLIWGCAAATAGALAGLARHEQPGFLFDELAREDRVAGVLLSDEYVDIGTPEALAAAIARYGETG